MRDVLRILTLIAALLITVIGAMLGIVGIVTSLWARGPDTLATVTSSSSIMILSTGLGAASAWQAWRAIRGYPSAAFHPRRIWILLALLAVALVLGQITLSLSLLPALTFPLLHVGATVLPALIIVALAGRAIGKGATWRDIVLQLASGAFLATPLAMVLEAVIILLVVAAAIFGFAWQPGSESLFAEVAPYLQDLFWLQEPDRLAADLLSPAVITLAFALAAILIPLIEEAIKTIGVALVAYRRPSLPQSLLWGMAAGAGFAAVEGLLNTTGALEAWLPVVLLRIGTTVLHCLTGALMGVAWYQLVTRRSWARALALYGASVAVHALWNGIAVGMALASMRMLAGDASGSGQALSGLTMLAMPALQIALALGAAGGLVGLTLYVRRQSNPPGSVRAQALPAPVGPVTPESMDPEE